MKTKGDKLRPQSQKKTNVTVIKCFICNQMFYTQNSFDTHMNQHSSKLSKDTPDQIQRKTMQSFRVKKNMEIKGTSTIKNIKMNKTVRVSEKPLVEPKIENTKKDESNEQLALRESTLLLEKLSKLTKQEQEPMHDIHEQNNQNQEQNVPKLKEEELIGMLNRGQKLTPNLIIHATISNSFIRSYQQQIIYLSQLGQVGIQLCDDKVKKIKNDILQTITMELSKTQTTNSISKLQGREEECEIVENVEVGYCGECYSQIDYGELCWYLGCGHKYHEECWEKDKACCK